MLYLGNGTCTIGLILLAGYFALGLVVPAMLFPKFRKSLGPVRYVVTMVLFLLMIGVPAKIVSAPGVQYQVYLPHACGLISDTTSPRRGLLSNRA